MVGEWISILPLAVFSGLACGSARKSALRHVVDTFFDGSVENVVAALVGGEAARVSDEVLERITELVRRAKKGAAR